MSGADGSTDSPVLLPSLQITRSGETATFALGITNTTNVPIDITYPTGQQADFTVRRGDQVLWRWSEGQMFTQAVVQDQLGPGETRRFEGQWEFPANLSGEFVATGEWKATGHPIEQAASFVLP